MQLRTGQIQQCFIGSSSRKGNCREDNQLFLTYGNCQELYFLPLYYSSLQSNQKLDYLSQWCLKGVFCCFLLFKFLSELQRWRYTSWRCRAITSLSSLWRGMFSEPTKSKNNLITLLLNLTNLVSNVVKQIDKYKKKRWVYIKRWIAIKKYFFH